MKHHFLRAFAPPYPRKKLVVALFLLVSVYWFIPPVWRLHDDEISTSQVNKKGETVQVIMGPKTESWSDFHSIARCFPQAIITAEDAQFYSHHGFDFDSIRKNITYNWHKKKFVRGGSTISQQLVKIAFLSHEKSLIRKAREAVGTFLMELIISKEKILTWYMNLVELGPGIYGVKAGAKKYFGKSPKNLNLSECVQLALILPSPVKWSQSLRDKNLTRFAKKRFEGILTNMLRSGHISKSNWEDHMMRGNFGLPVRVVIKPPEPTEDIIDLTFPEDDGEDLSSKELPLFSEPDAPREESQAPVLDSGKTNEPEAAQELEPETQKETENKDALDTLEKGRETENDPTSLEELNTTREINESPTP